MANVENVVTSRKTFAIVGIAILHILASGVDQFISNVFRGEGYPHQVRLITLKKISKQPKRRYKFLPNFPGRSRFGLHDSGRDASDDSAVASAANSQGKLQHEAILPGSKLT